MDAVGENERIFARRLGDDLNGFTGRLEDARWLHWRSAHSSFAGHGRSGTFVVALFLASGPWRVMVD